MNAIELMVYEHTNIKKVLNAIRALCIKIVNNEEINYNIFFDIIDFVRNYADKHHHSKEEAVLFKKMSSELVDLIGEGPIHGMHVEHDQGRLFIANLEKAVNEVIKGNKDARIDVIGNAIAYTDLLFRHIHKEDNMIYVFASKNLSEESLADLEKKCTEIEELASGNNLQSKYIDLARKIEESAYNQRGIYYE